MEANSNTQKVFLRGVWIAGIATAILILAASRTQAVNWLESGTLDVRSRWTAQPRAADPRIVILDIDNASLSGLQEQLGRWPWTRRVWTEVIRYVSRGKPSVIAIDIVFSGKESDSVDGEFSSVIHSAGNVVLGYSFVSTQMEMADPEPERHKLELLAPYASIPGLAEPLPASDFSPNPPLDQIARSAAALGCLNSSPDPDGKIRHVPLYFAYKDRAYPSFCVRTVQIASNGSGEIAFHRAANAFDSSFATRVNTTTSVDSHSRMFLLWHGDSFVYPRLPLWQVICSIYPAQCPGKKVYFPPEYFADKIVLLGASATGSYDHHSTPFDAQAPGVLAHATAIDNLLHGEAIREAQPWVGVVAILLMTLLGMALLLRARSMSMGVPLLLGLLFLYGAGSVAAFRMLHFAMPLVAPVFALVMSYGSSTAVRYATTGRELRRTRGMLDRYIAPQLVNYVMENLDTIHLAGDKRELTILISDVRNFTTMTEKSEPMELIALLDDYLSAMTEIIFKYNGIVDKFIGDGILAYWGAFTPGSRHAEQAAHAALEMLERLKQLNKQWVEQGKNPIAIGVGINTGTVIFGNIGRGKKIEFTVIGDAVNLASRLEGLNKDFGTSIIVSESTRQHIGEAAQVRPLGGVTVKGKTIATTVYELQGLTSPAASSVTGPSKTTS
jgi:adenylate cyclase